MHKEILSEEQIKMIPLVKQFIKEFYLVGGTAIALNIGHRRSIDFDLFKFTTLNHKKIITRISESGYPYKITRRVSEQLNVTVGGVTFTFFEYPFKIEAKNIFENSIRLPDLIDLSAMKAYALGRRSKWKDYVDMYFILKHHYSIKHVAERATEIYGQLFSEKLFRAQLCYFDDINYSESIDYIVPEVHPGEIKTFLIDMATEF
jgi:hypothetical protein